MYASFQNQRNGVLTQLMRQHTVQINPYVGGGYKQKQKTLRNPAVTGSGLWGEPEISYIR